MHDDRDHQIDEGDDAVVRALKACDIAITRANYLKLIYGDELPEKWSPELEGQLPKYLQDWTQVSLGTMKRGIKKSGRRKWKR